MLIKKLFGKYKFITMSVIILILIICLLLLIFSIFKQNSSKTSLNEDTEPSSEYIHENSDKNLSGDSCFLLVCSDSTSDDIVFMMLADFKIYSASLVLTPLIPETTTENGKTYIDNYAYGGINTLRDSIEQVRNIHIDRYAVLDNSGVTNLTELMGEVTLNVEEKFTYHSSDKTYEVEPGENLLGSDMLFAYFKVYAQKHGDIKTAHLICDITNTYISSFKEKTVDTQNLFSELTNCFTTDLTISDYYSALTDIEYLSENNLKCTISNDLENR